MRQRGGIHLGDRVLAGPVDDVVQRPLAAHVVDAHELQQRGVDEAHAHAVPHVHRRQVRHHRQRRPKTVRCREKIQHCCYTCIQNENRHKNPSTFFIST